jgi:hypothetical protein
MKKDEKGWDRLENLCPNLSRSPFLSLRTGKFSFGKPSCPKVPLKSTDRLGHKFSNKKVEKGQFSSNKNSI